MKKSFLLLLCSFITVCSFAQTSCLDFENETPNPIPNNWTNPPSTWTNLLCDYDFRQEASGNIYLESKDQSGGSWMVNTNDFTGDLSSANTCQTFCYDINYLDAGNNLGFYTNSIYIFSGGTTPQNSTFCASYVLNTPINAMAGWTTICLPLDFCSGVALPYNTEGYFRWYTSSNSANIGANCNDWNALIQNVSGIGFFVDRGGQQTEQWGYDNFCLIDTTCYNNKTFSSCFYTDPIDPTLNDHNEYGFAAAQTDDGEYMIFGETENRSLPGENSSSDYLLYTSLDFLGNVNAPSNYVYSQEPANLRYTDHFVVEMDPPFASQPEPYIQISNYNELGTNNKDIQITFMDESDCVASLIDWPDSPGASEEVRDAFQAQNGDLIILGEWNDNMPPIQGRTFVYGFTSIIGNPFGNGTFSYFDNNGSQTFDTDPRAICEYTNANGAREFMVTGEVDNQMLVQKLNTNLSPTGSYLPYDIDNNTGTTEIGMDVTFDDNSNTFLFAGHLNPSGIPNPSSQKIFLCKMNLQGQLLWNKVFDIAGGGESVEEIHLNDEGQIAITGSCELNLSQDRYDQSYLLKVDSLGNLIFANKYLNADGNEVQDLQFCIDEGYLLTGSCWVNEFVQEPFPGFIQNHDIWTVKTDSLGNIGVDSIACTQVLDVSITEPSYSNSIREILAEVYSHDGGNHDYICTPFLNNMAICNQYCPPPPGPDTLCDISASLGSIQNATCCADSLFITNWMYGAYKIQVDILNPNGAYFDFANNTGPYSKTTLSNSSLILARSNNAPLPFGKNHYMSFCVKDSFNINISKSLKITYLDTLCLPIVDCMDTLLVECDFPPVVSPCDSVVIAYEPTPDTTDYCCYNLMIYNPNPDYFTEIDITTIGTVDMVNRVNLNTSQWFTTSNTDQHIELLSTTGSLCPPANLKRYLPTGNLMPVKFCLDNYPTNNQQLYVKLDACNGDSCTQVLDFECNTSCVEIVSDSIWCDSSIYKYAFEFTNTWDKDIRKATVINLNPATANVVPDTLHFNPPIPVNGTYMDTFCFSNVTALDSLKFQIQFLEEECCWCVSDPICMEVPECPCSPCDSLEYVLTPNSLAGDSCCFTLDLYNYCADSIKTIRTKTLNGTQFLSQSATFPWSYDNYLPPTEADWYPLPFPPGTNPVPLGWTTNKINFCLTGLNNNPSNNEILEVSLVDFNDNEICKDTLEACAIVDTCLVILPDTMICLDNGCRELRWSVRNESSFDAQKILINTAYTFPTVGSVSPTAPFTYVGSIPMGATVVMPPITICGVDSTDLFCIQASIYDTLQLNNNCCHSDTVCIPIPPCPVLECAPCDSLEYVLTPDAAGGDSCCFTLDLYNYCADSIKTIRTRTLNGTQFLTQSATFPWAYDNYLPPTESDWYPLPFPPGTNPVPLGWTNNKINFCLTGLNNNPSNNDILEVSLVDFNDNEICKDTLEACAIVDTCLVILPDSFVCLDNGCRELHWSVRNESSFDAQKILINTAYTFPTLGSISPTAPFTYVGSIPMGATVVMPPITVCGVDSTDLFCLQASIYDTLQMNNNCCHSDTVCVLIPPCPDMVFDCDSLDWTGFDIVLDTTCVGNQYPDVGVTPVLGGVTPDWISYDFDCDLGIDQTDFGPTYPSVNWPNSGNSFFLICATAYKIVGNDTCDYEVIKEIGLESCPPTPDCCQDEDIFNSAVDTGFVFTQSSSMVTIVNMLLDSCHQVDVFWGDGTSDNVNGATLPITHIYNQQGMYTVCVLVTEIAEDGSICWEREFCSETFEILIDANHEIISTIMQVYPNPTESELIVDFGQIITYQQIEIYDIVGRLVMTQKTSGATEREMLDVGDLPTGAYIIKVSMNDGANLSKRFIKQEQK